jgi:hypothetical protein
MINKKFMYVGFNLPSDLYKHVQSQLKQTYKTQTEYFKELVVKDKQNTEKQQN